MWKENTRDCRCWNIEQDAKCWINSGQTASVERIYWQNCYPISPLSGPLNSFSALWMGWEHFLLWVKLEPGATVQKSAVSHLMQMRQCLFSFSQSQVFGTLFLKEWWNRSLWICLRQRCRYLIRGLVVGSLTITQIQFSTYIYTARHSKLGQ